MAKQANVQTAKQPDSRIADLVIGRMNDRMND